jgi:hypothetical protein
MTDFTSSFLVHNKISDINSFDLDLFSIKQQKIKLTSTINLTTIPSFKMNSTYTVKGSEYPAEAL